MFREGTCTGALSLFFKTVVTYFFLNCCVIIGNDVNLHSFSWYYFMSRIFLVVVI